MSPYPLFLKGEGGFFSPFFRGLLWPGSQAGLNVGSIDDLAGGDAVRDDALPQEKSPAS